MSVTFIQTVTIGAGLGTSIDFTSIPQTYTDLMVVLTLRNTSTYEHIKITINGSASSFTGRYLTAGGSGAAGSGVYGQYLGNATRDAYTAATFSNTFVYITNYSSTTVNKSITSDSMAENNTATANLTSQGMTANVWANNAAITSLSFVNEGAANYNQYSSATLFGITKGSSGGVTVA